MTRPLPRSVRTAPRPPSWPAPFLLLVVIPWMLACLVPVGKREEKRYVVTQRARLPAPEGPKAVGTMTEPGKIALQGGFAYSHVVPGESNEERAALGHLVHDRTFRGKLAMGLGRRVELGFGGTYSHKDWSTDTTDLPLQNPPTGTQPHKFLGTLQSRFLLFGDRKMGMAMLVEGDFGTANFQRTTDITTTTILINLDGSETRLPPEHETLQEDDTDFFWVARAGLQGFYPILPWLTLQGGLLGQNYPRYWARRVLGTTCEDDFIYDEQPAICQGSTPDDVSKSNMTILGTLFTGLSLEHRYSPLSAHVQFHYNVLGPETIRRALPFGAVLAVRLTL